MYKKEAKCPRSSIFWLSDASLFAEDTILNPRLTLLQNADAQNYLRANVLPYWFRAFICRCLLYDVLHNLHSNFCTFIDNNLLYLRKRLSSYSAT